MRDEALLQDVAAGRQDAMRILYDRHYQALRAFTATRLQDQALVLDVVHDVMLDVWRRPEAFSGRSSFRTWLFTLARNKAIDQLRKTSRIEYGDDGPDLIDTGPLPEDVLQAAQDRERVRACIAGLSESQKGAIHLTFFEGFTVNEAAEIESVPPGTIKTRIFHAKKLIAACLGA